MVTVADLNCCALCPLPEAAHPVQGFGHMDDTKNGRTTLKDFVAPSADLLAHRRQARMDGRYEIAEVHPATGEPTTHFVRAACRCGATALATREQAAHARCSACVMSKPPIWLLDIDGVINANRPGWSAPPRRVWCAGFTIRWAPALIARLREFHRMGSHEIRWASTWCGYPEQLDELARHLGLRFDRAFTDRPASKTWAEMKAEAAVTVLAEGRRLIWTDDDEALVAPAFYPEIATAEREGRALLIAPRSNRGLQPSHLDEIAAFALDPNAQCGAAS